MKKKRLPKSLRVFIRREKAKIRRGFSDLKDQEEKISQLYKSFIKK